MCFSAPVSFVASAALAAVGVACLRATTNRKQVWIALTPFFFSIQQLSEGVIWTSLTSAQPNLHLLQLMQHVFLFFANFFWPLWFPFVLVLLESSPIRRKILQAILILGIFYAALVWSSYSDWVSTSSIPVICSQSIQYNFLFQESWAPIALAVYYLNVTLPFLISSFPLMWLFGILVAIAYPVADYFYSDTCFSVWCFFGAILSVVLFISLWTNKRGRFGK